MNWLNLFNQQLRLKVLNQTKFQNSHVEQVRSVHRAVNIKKPMSHWRRDVVKAATKPKYVKRYNILPIDELCTNALIHKAKMEHVGEIHPYFRMLADEHLEKLRASKFIAIFHTYAKGNRDLLNLRLDLDKIDLSYMHYTKGTIKIALQGTEFESLLQIYKINTLTFLAPEANFSRLLKILKKFPYAVLIGGVYEGRVLSVTDIRNLAENPHIEAYQGQLSGLLATPAQRIVSSLTQHQQELCSSLQRYIDDRTKEKTPEA